MEIIFQGSHNSEQAAESFLSVLRLFKERYHVENFREMHFSVTLVNAEGEEVELVDSETSEAYRLFEVHRQGQELAPKHRYQRNLKLVIDNTRS